MPSVRLNTNNFQSGYQNTNSFQPGYQNTNNFQNLPFRIITNGGYGCCMNTFGPCCNDPPAHFVLPTFSSGHSNFGSFHDSHSSPSSGFQTQQDWPPVQMVQNNMPFPELPKNPDNSLTSGPMNSYPQQYFILQDPPAFKDPYGGSFSFLFN
ncbi:hypothetical protein FO519_004410 [Halicephalobus sp. NKZ332]|nr:hypothetical protein FO519_004410 [Halicephalobus sp. NKZ332]